MSCTNQSHVPFKIKAFEAAKQRSAQADGNTARGGLEYEMNFPTTDEVTEQSRIELELRRRRQVARKKREAAESR